ncbi:MAG: AraC family transcriptional regulator [Oscillospiraceae bacterium]|nr:AraC family transcriptional regulator [Oscillospiraceae bacterium]
MEQLTSCKEAIKCCMETKRFAVAYLYNEEKTMEMHIHDNYELYISLSGGKQFFIGESCYEIEPGDVFVINNYESHYVVQQENTPHERIVVSVHPEFLKCFSTEKTNIAACFNNRGADVGHRISLDKEQQQRLIYLLHKVTSADGYGADLIETAAFLEVMVLVNGLFSDHNKIAVGKYQYNELVGNIIEYINQNVTGRVTISAIASHFYLSDAYVCRAFKSETGTTINKYLVARRISIAKALLAQGASVNEACEKSGFNDYTNFVKSFKKAVGLSPKSYGKYSVN